MLFNRTMSMIIVLMMLLTGLWLLSPQVEETEAAEAEWCYRPLNDINDLITDTAIGDCDNDGDNELVVVTGGVLWAYVFAYHWNGVDWTEERITRSTTVGFTSVAIGDGDNDGENEIVVGTNSASTQLHVWSKEDGVWSDDPVNTGLNANISDIALGDPDLDGRQEIACGFLRKGTSNLRCYEYNVVWLEDQVATLPSEVRCLAIGDINHDHSVELVVGCEGGVTNEIRYFENVLGTWGEHNVADTPVTVRDIAIGDMVHTNYGGLFVGLNETSYELRSYIYNGVWYETKEVNVDGNITHVELADGTNIGWNRVYYAYEMYGAVGTIMEYYADWTTYNKTIHDRTTGEPMALSFGDIDNDDRIELVYATNQIGGESLYALYHDPKQSITMISPEDGSSVSEEFEIEVLVRSDYTLRVEFYINNTYIGCDSEEPYTCFYDARYLMEDDQVVVRAVATSKYGNREYTGVTVTVDNVLDRGDHINVSMVQPEYSPDQIATAMVEFNTSHDHDSVMVVMNCTDPWGNTYFVVNETVDRQWRMRFPMMVPSDAPMGEYKVNTIAYGIRSGSVIWKTLNTTSFTVSGKNTLGWLHAINTTLNDIGMTIGEIRGLTMLINDTFTHRMDGLSDDLNNIHMSLWDKVNETDAHITDEIRISMDDIMRMLEEVNGSTHMNSQHADDLRMWLEQLLPALNQTINDLEMSMSQDIIDIKQMLSDMDVAISDGIERLSAEIAVHDQGTNENISVLSEKLLGLKGEDVDLSEIIITLDQIEGNLSGDDGGLSQSIADLRTLVTGYRDEIMQKLDEMNGKIDDLATLEEISTELETVEEKVDSTDQTAASSQASITMSLVLSVIIAILALICVALLALLVKSKISAPAPAPKTTKKAPPMEEQEDDEVAKEEEE